MSDSSIKAFSRLLQHYIRCEQKLQAFKMSHQELEKAFYEMDQARRGRLEVGDLYRKFPHFNQDELFFVFKQLDLSRAGFISLCDLKAAIGTHSRGHKFQDGDSVDKFRQCVKILQMNYHEMEKVKHTLGINEDTLKKVFNEISAISSQQSLRTQDILAVFAGNHVEIDELEALISTKIMHGESMPVNEFIHFFKPFSWNSQKELIERHSEVITKSVHAQQRTADRAQIDKIINKYRNLNNQESQPTGVQERSETPNMLGGLKKVSSEQGLLSLHRQTRTGCTTPSSLTPSKAAVFQNQRLSLEEGSMQTNTDPLLNPNQADTCINKRRQELRRGSQERKKIIENLINRKNQEGTYLVENQQLRSMDTTSKLGYKSTMDLRKYCTTGLQSNWLKQHNDSVGDRPHLQREGLLRQPELTRFEVKNESLFNNTPLFTDSRPCSASKGYKGNLYHHLEREQDFIQSQLRQGKTEMSGIYRKKYPDCIRKCPDSINNSCGFSYNKQNILRRAQDEAAKKIEEIQRKARLKVMQKRSAVGIYNHWLK